MQMKSITVKATNSWLPYGAPRWMRIVEYNIRTKVLKQRSYLIDKWTIGEDEILETQIGDVTK